MEKSTLIMTHVMFRHGQRAPDFNYPYQGDPYAKEKYMPFGPSELTLTGRKHCYYFGQKLRQRYADLLGPEYYYGVIDAKTSIRSRAQTSLKLVLASLFPPTPSTQIDPQLNWQPVPYTSQPLKDDKLIGCALISMTKLVDHPDFRKTQNSQDVINCVKEQLKWDMSEHFQCMVLYDTIRTQAELGLPVSQWCQTIFPDKLRKEYECFTQYNYTQKNFLVGAIGGFIQEVSRTMMQKVSDIQKGREGNISKMYLYSGHDTNMTALLSIFQKFDATNWPKYLSNIAFELHQVDEEFYVKVVYQDGPKDPNIFKEDVNLEIITMPNTKTTLWKLQDFNEFVREYFLEPLKE